LGVPEPGDIFFGRVLVPAEVAGLLGIGVEDDVRLLLGELLVEGLRIRGGQAAPDPGRPPVGGDDSPIQRIVPRWAIQGVGGVPHLAIRKIGGLAAPVVGHG
jgi:hypothetical protein